MSFKIFLLQQFCAVPVGCEAGLVHFQPYGLMLTSIISRIMTFTEWCCHHSLLTVLANISLSLSVICQMSLVF
jgi:hypothetical protein